MPLSFFGVPGDLAHKSPFRREHFGVPVIGVAIVMNDMPPKNAQCHLRLPNAVF